MSSLLLLSGCATQNSVTEIDNKITSIKTELNETNDKVVKLSETQVNQKAYLENEIKGITVEYSKIDTKIDNTENLIEHINLNLNKLSKKTDAISQKMFPEKYKKHKKHKVEHKKDKKDTSK